MTIGVHLATKDYLRMQQFMQVFFAFVFLQQLFQFTDCSQWATMTFTRGEIRVDFAVFIPGNDFYFIGGSDLVPSLDTWDFGMECIEHVNFVL